MTAKSAPGATARPWYAGPNYLIGGWWVSREPEPERQSRPGAEITDCVRQEDAEFIARVANAHDALVAALEAFLEPAGDTPEEVRAQGRAALALVRAKGRPS